MNDWSNEEVLLFLECYKAESCIWDPKSKDHKDKTKVADAWNRLAEAFNKPVKTIKAKKENLMATFRKHLKKKQDSIRSGAGADDIYEPIWFAYQPMESFLLPVYTTKIGLNSEMQSRSSETSVEETVDESQGKENESSFANTFTVKGTEKSRRRTADVAERQMAAAFSQLTDVLRQRASTASDKNEENDECGLYARLLAKKMRELPKDDRKLIMYEIYGLFVKRIQQSSFSRQTLSPCHSYQIVTPSPAPSGNVVIPSQPKLIQTAIFTPNQDKTPQNMDDNVNINPTERDSPHLAPAIHIISNDVIVPAKHNILSTALLEACGHFEQDDDGL